MTTTNQLSRGVTTLSPAVLWLPDAKVTTVRRKRSAGSQKISKRQFQASLLRIANSPATLWHDFAQVCESAGL